jgi:hypothetical protein
MAMKCLTLGKKIIAMKLSTLLKNGSDEAFNAVNEHCQHYMNHGEITIKQ